MRHTAQIHAKRKQKFLRHFLPVEECFENYNGTLCFLDAMIS
jgi:hypothetical protein